MPSFDRPQQPESGVSAWVARFAPLIVPGGHVLDLAAGHGRHTHAKCEVVEADLETGDWPFIGRAFDGIVMTNYLHRPHFSRLVDSLAADGVLLVETFAAGNEHYGRPRNPDFLLQPGELLQAFGGELQVVAYEHGLELEPRPAVRQRLCAVRDATTRELVPSD